MVALASISNPSEKLNVHYEVYGLREKSLRVVGRWFICRPNCWLSINDICTIYEAIRANYAQGFNDARITDSVAT